MAFQLNNPQLFGGADGPGLWLGFCRLAESQGSGGGWVPRGRDRCTLPGVRGAGSYIGGWVVSPRWRAAKAGFLNYSHKVRTR